MSKIFKSLELKMVQRSLDWTKRRDPKKYRSICDLLNREGVNFSFDGKHHWIENERSDQPALGTGVNDQSDSAALSGAVSD